MDLRRALRHCCYFRHRVRRLFPTSTLKEIEVATQASETGHGGEVVVAIEGGLTLRELCAGLTPRERAFQVFSELGVWDTECNHGVLIYLLLADRAVEIVADRGINKIVGPEGWAKICREMEEFFRAGDFRLGVLTGVERVTAVLVEHFPRRAGDRNELVDKPSLL